MSIQRALENAFHRVLKNAAVFLFGAPEQYFRPFSLGDIAQDAGQTDRLIALQQPTAGNENMANTSFFIQDPKFMGFWIAGQDALQAIQKIGQIFQVDKLSKRLLH